ncbi:MAG: spermidine/putrescine ABC transporter substrate-binding protein [Lachnospiraceae bacterium]|jgi:spermidine/putrescine transport system substrate-binding protein|nr:spermidine/putrescine ABC transporter substrate-binding protein [Lachnospiraceae bacterium]
MKKQVIAMMCSVVFCLTAITGCGSSQEATGMQEGHQVSGELNLFAFDEMFPDEVLDGFEKETGVKINYSSFDTDEAMLAKLAEAQGGAYDVVFCDDYIIEPAINDGLVLKLDTSRIVNYGNLDPRFMSQFYDPNNEYTVPYGAGIPLIVYDPALTDVEITGYADLWDPALKDNVAITANYRVISGITLLAMGKHFNEEDLSVIDQAGEKMLELAPNIRVIDDSNAHEKLLSGEVAAAFLYTSQVYQAMSTKDSLKMVYPEEGLGYGFMAGFIPSKAPNMDAAYAFLDYINRAQNAAKCFDFFGYYCTNKAAEPYISPDMRQFVVLPEDAATGEIIFNVSQEAEDRYLEIWDAFKKACD